MKPNKNRMRLGKAPIIVLIKVLYFSEYLTNRKTEIQAKNTPNPKKYSNSLEKYPKSKNNKTGPIT